MRRDFSARFAFSNENPRKAVLPSARRTEAQVQCLPSHTMSTAMSAGDTPEILDACPRFRGRILSSFCLASSLSAVTENNPYRREARALPACAVPSLPVPAFEISFVFQLHHRGGKRFGGAFEGQKFRDDGGCHGWSARQISESQGFGRHGLSTFRQRPFRFRTGERQGGTAYDAFNLRPLFSVRRILSSVTRPAAYPLAVRRISALS